MPVYRFKCECSLQFERKLAMGAHPTHKCPECTKDAPRLFAGTNLGLKFAQGSSPTSNSGFHDLDYPTADKAVGRDADIRWDGFMERDKLKQKVRNGGQQKALIRKDLKTGETEYRTMVAPEKEARDKFFDKEIAPVAVDRKVALEEARKKSTT